MLGDLELILPHCELARTGRFGLAGNNRLVTHREGIYRKDTMI
jgi:hypothetical protein